MKKWEWTALLALILSVAVTGMAQFAAQCEAVRQDTIRLHILANSDSQEDQAVKLEIRDEILRRADSLFEASTKQQTLENMRAALPQLTQLANEVLEERGFSYRAGAEVTRCYFGTRVYGNYAMPAGEYDAVRITLGEAKGQNWWCVLFPPLCIPAAAAQRPDGLDFREVEGELIENAPQYELKFAVVEAFERLKEQFQSDT